MHDILCHYLGLIWWVLIVKNPIHFLPSAPESDCRILHTIYSRLLRPYRLDSMSINLSLQQCNGSTGWHAKKAAYFCLRGSYPMEWWFHFGSHGNWQAICTQRMSLGEMRMSGCLSFRTCTRLPARYPTLQVNRRGRFHCLAFPENQVRHKQQQTNAVSTRQPESHS